MPGGLTNWVLWEDWKTLGNWTGCHRDAVGNWVLGKMNWVPRGTGLGAAGTSLGAAGLGQVDTHLAAARAAHRILAPTCITLDELLACGERR